MYNMSHRCVYLENYQSASLKYKARKNSEVPYKALFKSTLNKQINFGILTLNRNDASWLSHKSWAFNISYTNYQC